MEFEEYIDYVKEAMLLIDKDQVENLIEILFTAYRDDKMIFIIGNGGSAANASHFAQDLAKGTRLAINQKKRFKALSLTDNVSFIAALANDDGYETVFEQQLMTYAGEGDVLIAISGSGNSINITKAVEWANRHGLLTVGVTGFDGGMLRQINRHSLHVPLHDMCSAESIHSAIFHFIIIRLQDKLKKGNADLDITIT